MRYIRVVEIDLEKGKYVLFVAFSPPFSDTNISIEFSGQKPNENRRLESLPLSFSADYMIV